MALGETSQLSEDKIVVFYVLMGKATARLELKWA